MFSNYPDVVSVEDVQAMLHIGRNAAYGLLQSGAIVTIRVGKKYIIPKASVIDFLGLNKGAKPGIIAHQIKRVKALKGANKWQSQAL